MAARSRLALACSVWLCDRRTRAESLGNITIDGNFSDWSTVPTYYDALGTGFHTGTLIPDVHDTDHNRAGDTPVFVDHPDVDIREYKFTHDANNLYAYFKATGEIGRTQTAAQGKAGRYYVICTIDVDNDDSTGYLLHEGGYYPTSAVELYDANLEVEFYDGAINTGHYLSHDALNATELQQDFVNLTDGNYPAGQPGPYPPGFVQPAPGNYNNYTQWVYHNDDTLTLVYDRGPAYPDSIMEVAVSGHEIEICAPFKGFLDNFLGDPNMELGKTIDISFSLEASGELWDGVLPLGGDWASDTADPIVGYILGASAPSADFDQDHDIDGADFLIWQQNSGLDSDATLAQGDANDDRRVGGSDQVVWRQQFGQTVAAAAVTVPEPASMLLALTMLFAVSVVVDPWIRARDDTWKFGCPMTVK